MGRKATSVRNDSKHNEVDSIVKRKKKVIVIVAPVVETWATFKKMCKAKEWPYHTLKGQKFPIYYLEFEIHRTPLL